MGHFAIIDTDTGFATTVVALDLAHAHERAGGMKITNYDIIERFENTCKTCHEKFADQCRCESDRLLGHGTCVGVVVTVDGETWSDDEWAAAPANIDLLE